MHAVGGPDHDWKLKFGYMTAFGQPKKIVSNPVVAPSAGGTCLVLQC